MSNTQQQTQQAARDTAHNIKGVAQDMTQRATHKVEDVYQRGQHLASDAVDKLDRDAVRPAAHYAQDMGSKQPMLTTLAGSWLALSLIPISTFVAWSTACFTVVGGTALGISLTILTGLVGTAGLMLLGTCGVTLFLAGVATFFILSAWATYRLAYQVMNAPSLPDGLRRFMQDLKVLILGDRALPQGEHDASRALGAKSMTSS